MRKIGSQRRVSAALVAMLLAACGGTQQSGTDSTTDTSSTTVSGFEQITAVATRLLSGSSAKVIPEQSLEGTTANENDELGAASRFLAQATFGANMYEIRRLADLGYDQWLESQFAAGQSLHRPYMDEIMKSGRQPNDVDFYSVWWKNAISGGDPLRLRATYALSQIFVVSFQDSTVASYPRGVSSYYDTLGKYAFGNFRDLLEAVALHPMMGLYMSHMRNQKEDGDRKPDENFAREIMQLMTIGLYMLNQDGTLKLSGGSPIETYTETDVAELAKVFTGWAWYGPDKSSNRFHNGVADPNRDWRPMQNYPDFHSTGGKQVLGVEIPAGGTAEADLKIALDTLFNHPNVGPFISRQLIQRLVTSNPSPAYVSRVAAAFNNNGSGVRGDMRAVWRAILLDPEARPASVPEGGGKLREPVLRLAHWARAFNARSISGRYRMWATDDPLSGLAQTPMRAPSVFNFYRPGYVPPHSELAAQNLVSPEMQLTGEASVIGYLNLIQAVIAAGMGDDHDIVPGYSAEFDRAGVPANLVERINILLLGGRMSSALRSRILSAVESIDLPKQGDAPQAVIAKARANRTYLAIFLAMASPEYLAQQ
jgi:uncharacterized protein (DUF1800 family)